MFAQCSFPPLLDLRQKLSADILCHVQSLHPNHPTFTSTEQRLSQLLLHNLTKPHPDHRNLLGLFPVTDLVPLNLDFPSTRAALKQLCSYTIPYLQNTWSLYCHETHISQPSSPPRSPSLSSTSRSSHPPRLIILSGNNATISLQTVNDFPPSLYHTRSKRSSRTKHPTPSSLTSLSQPLTQTPIIQFFRPSPSFSLTPISTRLPSPPNPSLHQQ